MKSLEIIENKGRKMAGDPTPGVLGQRVRKLLKTKERECDIVQRVRKLLKTKRPEGGDVQRVRNIMKTWKIDSAGTLTGVEEEDGLRGWEIKPCGDGHGLFY